ncbi:MAG: hypothetical protein KA955_03785 [Prevotella sp.]|nr:hypothetical protein [Prevotella sp.]
MAEETLERPIHHSKEKNPKRYLALRNILNIIFMIGALVGLLIYLFSDEFSGTIVIMAAMAIKIIESVLRITYR